jgi:hypothetical protein
VYQALDILMDTALDTFPRVRKGLMPYFDAA